MLILDKNLIFDISCWALNGKFLENFLLLIINYRHLNIPTNVMKIRHILYFSCWFFMNRLLIIDKFDENWSRIGQFFSYLMLIFDENLIFLVWALNGQFQLSMKIRAKLVHFFHISRWFLMKIWCCFVRKVEKLVTMFSHFIFSILIS